MTQSTARFPLYFKNMDERRFDCALILLNKDIQQLLNVSRPNWRLLANHSPMHTLQNLSILLGQHD
jgi:hypothetical protein